MGLTVLDLDIANPANVDRWERVTFLVDSGAVYSVVPRSILERLEVKPLTRQIFRLANGDKISRDKGGAVFRYGDRVGVADVIFGEEGDSSLLGALTLEALGFSLDPLRRELNPLPMILALLTPPVPRSSARREHRHSLAHLGLEFISFPFLTQVVVPTVTVRSVKKFHLT